MSDKETLKAWEAWNKLPARRRDKIIEAFYQSALYLRERIERDGWEWSDNYLREHSRCAFHVHVTNTPSPAALEVLRQTHPDVVQFKYAGQSDIFGTPLPPKPKGPPPPTNAHLDDKGRLIHNRCAVCWSPDAPFGQDVALKDGVLGMWYCQEHRPQIT